MKILALIIGAALALPALAQSDSSSRSDSAAVSSPSNIGNPVINMPNATPFTAARIDQHTNQAATPGTVFVNPPAADTCARAGSGIALQGAGAGGALTIGGGESAKCDMRADAINLKVTGADYTVIKARHCMDPQMAEAYARAGQECVDRRPASAQPSPQAVRQQPKPWEAGG